jgi:putative DNA primase/helicase
VRIVAEDDDMPRAIEVTVEAVRVLAHELCRPVKINITAGGVDYSPTTLSNTIANLYLYGLEGQWGLKLFRGITTAPILSDDGSIRAARGYDPRSGLWCHNIPSVTVPDQPSRDDALAALNFLRSTFKTFPFADAQRLMDPDLGVDVIRLDQKPGMDESTFLVGLMTAVCRAGLPLAPGLLLNAPSGSGAGTGKGLLVRAMCIIASGAKPSAFTSGHDKEEFDKRLTAAFIEARPAVFLDNFNAQQLKSDILAAVLTEDPAMVRIMGQTKNVPLHTRTFVAITGNGVQIAEDMVRRILLCKLNAKMADPEQRKFAPGFLDHIYALRPQLLSACLTIWRWGRQNDVQAGIPLGSYEVWSAWCRDPLLALGCTDPVEQLAEIKADDPHRKQQVEVFETWWERHGSAAVKATELATEVLELIDTEAKKDIAGNLKFNRQWVVRWLLRAEGAYMGTFHLEKVVDKRLKRKDIRYRLVSEPTTQTT